MQLFELIDFHCKYGKVGAASQRCGVPGFNGFGKMKCLDDLERKQKQQNHVE